MNFFLFLFIISVYSLPCSKISYVNQTKYADIKECIYETQYDSQWYEEVKTDLKSLLPVSLL